MFKGTYTFPNKESVEVYYDPKRSDDKSVYVEWMSNHIKYTCWLPAEGLRYKG